MGKLYRCRCCGNFTLLGETEEDVKWDICPVCFWENDVFEDSLEKYSGANHMKLSEGRENYCKYGACSSSSVANVREPEEEELPENNIVMPEGFLKLRFFKKKDFYKNSFNDKEYIVMGEDDVGNFLVSDNGKRLLLWDTCYKNMVYISKDRKTFFREIELLYKYGGDSFPEDASDEELAKRENNFRRLLLEIDENALNGDTYWSGIAEEMGYGII